MTADVRMPYFGDEAHVWWFEGVFGAYTDVDFVVSAFVGRVGWAVEVAAEVGEVGDFAAAVRRGYYDARGGVFVDVLNLLPTVG